MKYTLTSLFFVVYTSVVFSQTVLRIEGTTVIDTVKGTSLGVVIPNNVPTSLNYKNNSITSVNAVGYMLCAGDEIPSVNNNNLDDAEITGNRFVWNGTDETSMTHALFTGYNIGVIIKYNYLQNVPNGIQRKSNGMNEGNGVIAYNIINNPKVGIVVKGMNNVKIYNNTLYSGLTRTQTSRGLIDIHTNFDNGLSALSTGTKIFNNVFYTKNRTLNIKIFETACLQGFESDYNLFWCESGEPTFEIAGTTLTFAQWQALGYDTHSVVVNPDFNNFVDFVPVNPLDLGKDLGQDMSEALSISASWGTSDPETSTQTGKWQVGARIYNSITESQTKIYPNPAFDELYIYQADGTVSYQAVRIYDPTGRMVLASQINQGHNTISIPRSFSSGLYNIALESDHSKRLVRKVVILR